MAKHRIKWIDKKTLQSGHGEWHDGKDIKLLSAWVEHGDKCHPEIYHWIETEPPINRLAEKKDERMFFRKWKVGDE
jgi:hypothetical protein